MNGAIPVPGPIRIMGWPGFRGRWNEFTPRGKTGTYETKHMHIYIYI